MQEPAGRRRATAPFAGVDLRRPKGYPAFAPPAEAEAPAEDAGDPCPRCESRDTKFCYYNNYNTSQPRHYCKSCRRYWTKGGTLRNVPVGGGSRKSSSASPSLKNPKRAKNSKRRRVAPAAPEPEPVASTDASVAVVAADPEATSTAEDNADDPAAPPAAEADSTDPSVALALGLTDAGGKEPSDQSPFEWPSGCDLGSYWAPAVFADTDPALFLDLP